RETMRLVREQRIVEGAFLPNGGQNELCSRDVLDAIRRKSLAKLRRSIEPVPAAALSRLILDWQGVTRKRRGREALRAVVGELEGCPLVASTLESEILAARIDEYRPWDLDALCASGEIVWAGLERLGANDGRVALYLADHEAQLARPSAPVPGAVAVAIRGVLERRGAVFFADIAREVGGFPNDLVEALWQMVWAGEATNDTLDPLRSRVRPSGSRARPTRGTASTPSRGRTHAAARSPRAGPPGCEGRWSLRASRWTAPPSDTDRSAAIARALLDRYGVVTREAAHAEGVAGGFVGIYDVLKALEARGRVRRGYLVEGRGGAQFALPGADERLRALRDAREVTAPLVLAATDPANAWGALLDWPPSRAEARPQRAAGALVVLLDGMLLGWMGRGDHPLLTFLPEDEPVRSEAAQALAQGLGKLVDSRARRALLVSSIDGTDAARSPLAPVFVRAGFAATARGLLRGAIVNRLATETTP
ncbi:MAG TPA: DEAD/DEAH box helicase, partial [Polyangiaceae bacterium]|nr:DEAD/DEAH box helicase [Polyangiaceae bacterium]